MQDEHQNQNQIITAKEVEAALNENEIHAAPAGLGMIGGAIAGAGLGVMGGPLGILIGAIVGTAGGAVVGSLTGEIALANAEDKYWREHYYNTPYYHDEYEFDLDYQPAFAIGYILHEKYGKEAKFEDVEDALERLWGDLKGHSRLSWEEARQAIEDAWNHVEV